MLEVVRIKRGRLLGQAVLLNRILDHSPNALSLNVQFGKLHSKFMYALSRTALSIDNEVVSSQTVNGKNEGYMAFLQVLEEVGKRYALRDDKDRPIRTSQGWQIDSVSQDDYAKQLASLREEHKDAIKEYEEFMNENVEVEVYKVKGRYVPEGPPNPAIVTMFVELIDYDDEDVKCPSCGYSWCLGDESELRVKIEVGEKTK